MSGEKNFYDEFDDLIGQLIDDQSLFECDIPEGCNELVAVGKILSDALTEFRVLGKFFWMSLPETDFAEIVYAVSEYRNLLLPPKICCGLGAYLSCLVKLSRSGIEYEKHLLVTQAIVIDAGYLTKLIVLDHTIEKMNSESIHFVDYTTRMNAIANSLANLSTKGNENNRENARVELLAILEQVDRFVKLFFEEEGPYNNFRMEACRRISQTGELLSSRSNNRNTSSAQPGSGGKPPPSASASSGIHRQVLVKAQANMQEIMNSAAGIAASKADEYADRGDIETNSFSRINGDLLIAKNVRVKNISALEDRMMSLQLDETLVRVKEQCEKRHLEAACKIKEAVKRWKIIRTQSNFRDVAVYVEEDESAKNSMTNDPMKALNKTGKQVGDGIKKAVNIPGNAAKGGAKVMMGGISGAVGVVSFAASGAVGAVTGGVKGAANGIASGVKEAANGIAKGVTGAVDGIKETFEMDKKKEEEPKKKGMLSSMMPSTESSPSSATKLFPYSAIGTSAANLFG